MELTIEELAERTGLTVRTIRSYQTRGLLRSPRLERSGGPIVGYYDDAHVARLELIGRMKKRGFSLEAIANMIEAWKDGRHLEDLLGLEQAITRPRPVEGPTTLARQEVLDLLPETHRTDASLERLEQDRLLERHGRSYTVPSPPLLRLAAELLSAGLSPDALSQGVALLRTHAEAAARELVTEMRPYVLEPLLEGGLSTERMSAIVAVLEQVPQRAADAMRLVFFDALRDVMEQNTAS